MKQTHIGLDGIMTLASNADSTRHQVILQRRQKAISCKHVMIRCKHLMIRCKHLTHLVLPQTHEDHRLINKKRSFSPTIVEIQLAGSYSSHHWCAVAA